MVSSALENCERGSRKKGRGPFTQVCFVPWIILGQDFVPPVTNIYIQIIRHVYSFGCWVTAKPNWSVSVS